MRALNAEIKMKRSQLNAISYAIQKRENAKREKFLIEKEGGLDAFNKSGYKTLVWYIKSKYGDCAR